MTPSAPIVLQLQALAIDEASEVPELLRKALVIATKLRLPAFKEWITSELSGYAPKDLPDYRKLPSSLKARLRGGWVPVHMPDHETQELVETAHIPNAIDQLAHLMTQGDGTLMMPFPPDLRALLVSTFPEFGEVEITRFLTRSQIAGVLAEVRNRILTWALELEEEGILGEGLKFSEADRAKAQMNQHINIGNFQGVLGDVSESTLHQNLSMAFGSHDVAGLRSHLKAKGIDDDSLDELTKAIEVDPKPTEPGKFGSAVSDWIGKQLQRAASGAWAVGIGAAGNLLATAIGHYYGLPTS